MPPNPVPLVLSVVAVVAVALVGLTATLAAPPAHEEAAPGGATRIAGDVHGPEPVEAEPRPAPDPEPQAAPLTEPDRTAVVWTSGGLPEGLASRLRAVPAVEQATIVRGGLLELKVARTADGEVVDAPAGDFVIPLDALSVNPPAYAGFYEGADAVAALAAGEALLSETSASLRRIDVGGTLETSGGEVLRVVGIVADEVIAGAELLVDVETGVAAGIATERFLLTRHDGDAADLDAAVRTEVTEEGERPARVAAAGDLRFVRHGSGILTQAQVKERFGEFSYRRAGEGRQVVQDPAWREEHIVRARVPILGTIRCHRDVIPLVADVLAEVEDAGLAHTVDPAGYAGCWNARLTNRLDALSRHSWGIAVDLNFPDNPVGTPGSMDPLLIAIFERHGFVWGGDWLLTDPTHFEVAEPLGSRPDR